MSIQHFLLTLVAMIAVAKVCGAIAERLGQTAVLGELVGGIIVGTSGLNLVHADEPTTHLLSELGVMLLLFVIGLQTPLPKLLAVGATSMAVAVTGVVSPLLLGFAVSQMLGLSQTVSLYVGATLTATSVGLTARILSDLGHLDSRESHVILGAAVFDDVIGLVLLAIVGALASGQRVSLLQTFRVAAIAAGFFCVSTLLGVRLVPSIVRLIPKRHLTAMAAIFAVGMALLADRAGSALVVGAFVAGVVLASSQGGDEIGRELQSVGDFLIPLFFVSVGAAVDLRALGVRFLVFGLVITAVAMIGKVMSGLPVWQPGLRRLVIGVGMIPRGEVGLIFAQIGLAAGVLSSGLYSSITLMVIVTALVTPPLLRILLVNAGAERRSRADYSHEIVSPG